MAKQTLVRTFLYKACPRCHGDLVLDAPAVPSMKSGDRFEYVCLQCGRHASLEAAAVTKAPSAASRAA